MSPPQAYASLRRCVDGANAPIVVRVAQRRVAATGGHQGSFPSKRHVIDTSRMARSKPWSILMVNNH